MKEKDIEYILQQHNKFWERLRPELSRYKNVYQCNFWNENRILNFGFTDQMISIQTADGYGYIESYIASLFSKNPAVVLKTGIRNRGSRDKAAAVANNFLLKARQAIENAARLSLIYPMAFFKLIPQDDEELFDKIIPIAVSPWDVIVDRDAPAWNRGRFVGHKYYIPVAEAKERFGNKKFEPTRKEDYFQPQPQGDLDVDGSMMKDYVQIVEFYDLVQDKLYFYCPHLSRDKKIIDESPMIPFRDVFGKPVSPIIPLYFNRVPDEPMHGYSAMKRVYDQLYEINIIRSFQANAIRKASRQYIVKAGMLDEEQMAKLTSGIDGLFVEVDEEDLAGSIIPLPHSPVSPEINRYYDDVKGDLDNGSILAPFTRGESTRATASEITALAAYTSSELGRLARERDSAIELLAKTYLNVLSTFIEDDVPAVINLDGEAVIIAPDDLKGDFDFFASDQSSTPLSEAVQKRQLLENLPTLLNLGVPQDKLLKEVVRTLNLPEDFLEAQPQLEEAGPQGPISAIDAPPTLAESIGGGGASPKKIAQFLPNQGDLLGGRN